MEEDNEESGGEDDLIGSLQMHKASVHSDRFFDQPSRQAAFTEFNKNKKDGNDTSNAVLNRSKEVAFLLDISKYASRNVEGLRPGTTILSQNGKFLYHISIIDYL